jgi:hypothetical protein
LLSVVEGLLQSLEKRILIKAFLEWMKRIELYIETDDDHVG